RRLRRRSADGLERPDRVLQRTRGGARVPAAVDRRPRRGGARGLARRAADPPSPLVLSASQCVATLIRCRNLTQPNAGGSAPSAGATREIPRPAAAAAPELTALCFRGPGRAPRRSPPGVRSSLNVMTDFTVRPAHAADMAAVHAMLQPYVMKRILLGKDLV